MADKVNLVCGFGVNDANYAVRPRDGRYVLARPENYKFDSWWYRIKLAWLVLVGRYDAIEWADGQ